MNRGKLERELNRLAAEDTCTICLKELRHKSMTYGGITATGEVAFAGECCKPKLKSIACVALYLANPLAGMTNPFGRTSRPN